MSIKAEVKTLSVDQMEALLDSTNGINRPLNTDRVGSLAQAMRLGTWQQNGQGIVISDKGRLLDGQHRVAAAIRVGKPFTVLVVSGVEEDAFKTMDNNKSRSVGDSLAAAGHLNGRNLSTVLRLFYAYQTGQITTSSGSTVKGWNGVEAEKLIVEQPHILTVFDEARKLRANEPTANCYPLAALCVSMVVTREHNEAHSSLFWNALFGHGKDSENVSIASLRRWLVGQVTGTVTRNVEYLAVTIKTFNAYVLKRDLRMLVWKRSEEFPKLEKIVA